MCQACSLLVRQGGLRAAADEGLQHVLLLVLYSDMAPVQGTDCH